METYSVSAQDIATNFYKDVVEPTASWIQTVLRFAMWLQRVALPLFAAATQLSVAAWTASLALLLRNVVLSQVLEASSPRLLTLVGLLWLHSAATVLVAVMKMLSCVFFKRSFQMWSYRAEDEDVMDDPRQIDPLTLSRPQDQKTAGTFTLDNGINVAYRLLLSSFGATNTIDLYIISRFDATSTPQTDDHLSRFGGGQTGTRNTAILYLPGCGLHSDTPLQATPRQFVRLHLAAVYNFVEILRDFGFQHVYICRDFHRYSTIFWHCDDRRILPGLFGEYYAPSAFVSAIDEGAFEPRWNISRGLFGNLKESTRTTLHDLCIPFLPVLYLSSKLGWMETFRLVQYPSALESTRQIEAEIVRRPFAHLINEMSQLVTEHRAAPKRYSALTAEYSRPDLLLASRNVSQDGLNIYDHDLKKEKLAESSLDDDGDIDRPRLFNVGSFTSWFSALKKEDMEQQEEEEQMCQEKPALFAI